MKGRKEPAKKGEKNKKRKQKARTEYRVGYFFVRDRGISRPTVAGTFLYHFVRTEKSFSS